MIFRENEVGRRIAPFLGRGETLLDLGAGTGFVSRWLSQRTGVLPTLADVVSYRNRTKAFPFIHQHDPFSVGVPDNSFDAVMLLFVLHHVAHWEDQERLLDEALRIASKRLIVIEDTPLSRIDLTFNKGWDWILNQRHRVPTPFTFRGVDEWTAAFKGRDLALVHTETYRPFWPTLGTYHHTLFVLDL